MAISAHSLYAAGSGTLSSIGFLLSHLTPVLIGHLLLIYPSGRFDARYQAWLVGLGYVDALLLAVPWILLFDPTANCMGCAQNPFLTATDEGLLQTLSVTRLALSALMTTGLAIALTQRWNAAPPTQRAALRPVIGAGGAAIGAFAVLFVAEIADAGVPAQTALNFGVLGACLTVPLAVIYGQIATRFSRAGAISDLVASIGIHDGQPARIEAALAEALEDPSLRFAYWLPAQQRFTDAEGHALPPSELAADRLWFPVELNGEPVAAVVYDRKNGDQSALLGPAGSAAALSLENVRLEAALRAQVEELKRSRALLVEATDNERRRIERDLHDGAQQHLISIALNLTFATKRIAVDPTEAARMVTESTSALTAVTEELRDLARGIHSAMLADRGLDAAVRALADRSALPVRIADIQSAELPDDVESTAYFVVSESLANAARNSNASEVRVEIWLEGGALQVEISDDGVGGANPERGTGLAGLASRVSSLDGEMQIISPDGEGTIVRATLPVDIVSQ